MQFIATDLKKTLKEQGVSSEPMDTGAACRTYNVLMAEGRRVAAAQESGMKEWIAGQFKSAVGAIDSWMKPAPDHSQDVVLPGDVKLGSGQSITSPGDVVIGGLLTTTNKGMAP